jgi:tRNA (guanine37-N1)-methyltransferase
MRFDVITLFPELFAPFLTVGINRRAFEVKNGICLVDVRLWNPRDFAQGTYRRIDDRPFGGGPGMVMMAEPLRLCLAAIRAERQHINPVPVVLFSPLGQKLDHASVENWSNSEGAVLVCGRYEGIDSVLSMPMLTSKSA